MPSSSTWSGQADGLIENNAARVMTQLGVGSDVLREVNPGLVMCSMAGFGATGPERNYSAYGSNIEAMSGLASVLGYGPGEYYGTGSYYADPVTGNHGAVAILAALHGRRATGRGRWIDMSLFEAVLPYFSQELLTYAATGESPEPTGNASPVDAPQGVYPCAGEDNWLALTVRDERDFAALAKVIGCPELAADGSCATVEARRAAAPRDRRRDRRLVAGGDGDRRRCRPTGGRNPRRPRHAKLDGRERQPLERPGLLRADPPPRRRDARLPRLPLALRGDARRHRAPRAALRPAQPRGVHGNSSA